MGLPAKDLLLEGAEVRDEVRLDGHRMLAPDLAQGGDGALSWVVRPPSVQERRPHVGIGSERTVGWRLAQDGDAVVLSVSEPARVDLMRMRGAVAEAFLDDAPVEELTLIGPYAALGGPRHLAAHVGADGPLMPAFGPGTRRLSPHVALSLYRIARWRGGPFWDAVAGWVADWAVEYARHLEHERGGRMISDLALLLLAAGEETACRGVLDAMETLATPLAGGTWYRHDRGEADAGRNDLVLNTHLYALLVMAAAGRPVAAGQRALDHALALRAPRLRGVALAGRITLTDVGHAGRWHWTTGAAAWQRNEDWARLRAAHPHLRTAPGLLARDRTGEVRPRFYRTVNLADLAALCRVAPTRAARRALRAGLATARTGAFFRVQRQSGAYAAVLVPCLLRNAGMGRAAERHAAALRERGWAPLIGWPGYVDELLPRLPAGVP